MLSKIHERSLQQPGDNDFLGYRYQILKWLDYFILKTHE